MAGGMRIVTNVAALQGVVANTNNSSNLQKSLERLSTGLKINAAKDNASGMAIANQLKTQASSLGAAIDNATKPTPFCSQLTRLSKSKATSWTKSSKKPSKRHKMDKAQRQEICFKPTSSALWKSLTT